MQLDKDSFLQAQILEGACGLDSSRLSLLPPAGTAQLINAIGALASRNPNQMMEWDAKGMQFVGQPELNKHVTRKYRDGWEVAGL